MVNAVDRGATMTDRKGAYLILLNITCISSGLQLYYYQDEIRNSDQAED